MTSRLRQLHEDIATCRRCPRLVAWREEVARVKRKAYQDWTYWGRPVPGFGDVKAALIILGLAPAAHGANRTGRMFTGDESGNWLYRALFHAGFANQPTSEHMQDGLALKNCYVTASARCAPPDNKPDKTELQRCAPFLDREFALLTRARVVVCLGKVAWDTYFAWVVRSGGTLPRPRPAFGHLAHVQEGLPHVLLGSYHPSQQNTFTGRLTRKMLDDVFMLAAGYCR